MEAPVKQKYGEMLRSRRKHLNLSIENVIGKLNRTVFGEGESIPTKSMISKIEHNSRLPSMTVAATLCAALNTPDLIIQHPEAKRYLSGWMMIAEKFLWQERISELDCIMDAVLEILQDAREMPPSMRSSAYRLKALSVASQVDWDGDHEDIPGSFRQRQLTAIHWLAQAESEAERSIPSATSTVRFFIDKAEIYNRCTNYAYALEYLFRAETYIKNVIGDREEKDELMLQVSGLIASTYLRMDDLEHATPYEELLEKFSYSEEYVRIKSRTVTDHVLWLCNRLNFTEALTLLTDGLALIERFVSEGMIIEKKTLWSLTSIYIWLLGVTEQYKEQHEVVNEIERTQRCIIHSIDFGEIYDQQDIERMKLIQRISAGMYYSDLQTELERFSSSQKIDRIRIGRIEELVGRAWLNEGESQRANESFRQGNENMKLLFSESDIEGFDRRCQFFRRLSL